VVAGGLIGATAHDACGFLKCVPGLAPVASDDVREAFASFCFGGGCSQSGSNERGESGVGGGSSSGKNGQAITVSYTDPSTGPTEDEIRTICALTGFCGDYHANPLPPIFGLGAKRDIQQVNSVAREFGMTNEQRREFGDFVEASKDYNNLPKGAKLPYENLRRLAKEFMGQ
jgi:hypothetical protein